MPEAAECRIIAEGLDSLLAENWIIGFDMLSGRYVRHDPPRGWDALSVRLPRRCNRVGVKGKFIFMELDDCSSIWVTLGMTGRWSAMSEDHARVRLRYAVDGVDRAVYFVDQRNFGTLAFSGSRADLTRKLNSLGLDHLNTRVQSSDMISVMRLGRNSGRTMAEVLMDQRNFAGIGNYVKAEALYRARVSPHRKARDVTDAEIEDLNSMVAAVVTEAYIANGATLRNYADTAGKAGSFKRVVYGQTADPEGNPVVSEMTLDGRTSWWVPNVQK